MDSNSNYDPYNIYRLRESCKEFVNALQPYNKPQTRIESVSKQVDSIEAKVEIYATDLENQLIKTEKEQRSRIIDAFKQINTLLNHYNLLIFRAHPDKVNNNVWTNDTIKVSLIPKYPDGNINYAFVLNTEKYVKDGTTDVKYLRAAGKFKEQYHDKQAVFEYEVKQLKSYNDYYYTEITDQQKYDLLEKESVDVFEAKDSHSFKEGSYYACVLLQKCIDYKTCLRRNLTYLGKFIGKDGEIKFDKTNINDIKTYRFVEVKQTDADFNQDNVLETYVLEPIQQPAQYGGRSKRNKKLNRNKTRRRIAKKLHA